MFGLPSENVYVSHDSNFWPEQGYYFVPGGGGVPQQQFQYSTYQSAQVYQEPFLPSAMSAGSTSIGMGSNLESDFDFFKQSQQHHHSQLQRFDFQPPQQQEEEQHHHSHLQRFDFQSSQQQQEQQLSRQEGDDVPFDFMTAIQTVEKRMGMFAGTGNTEGSVGDDDFGLLFTSNLQPPKQKDYQVLEVDGNNNSKLPVTDPHARIQRKLCETVARFRQEDGSKTPREGDKIGEESEDLNLSDIPDPESYVVFDKLWSSPDHLVARAIFHICQTLKTNFIIRFRALELYNRYRRMFIVEMHRDYFKTCTKSSFNEFLLRFETQILLRMCTCILIASKLHADSQIQSLTVRRIRKFLKKFNLVYSCDTISRSELRVLTTLGFHCHWVTPLDLIEQLLSLLDLTVTALQRAHYFSILLLEYFYVDMDNIRLKFSTSIKSSTRSILSHTPASTASNNGEISTPLLCAAIVSAALFIVSTEVKSNLHAIVAKTALLPEEDVNVLAILILDLLMK